MMHPKNGDEVLLSPADIAWLCIGLSYQGANAKTWDALTASEPLFNSVAVYFKPFEARLSAGQR